MVFDSVVIAQTIGTGATLAAAVAAWLTAREMRKQSRSSIRPYPILMSDFFERQVKSKPATEESVLWLENVGQGPMLNSEISWDLKLLSKSVRSATLRGNPVRSIEISEGQVGHHFMLGEVLNFTAPIISPQKKVSVKIPTVITTLCEMRLTELFDDENFTMEFNSPYFYAKLQFNDVHERIFIAYYRVDLNLIYYHKSSPNASYGAEWKVSRSNYLEY